MIQDLLEQVVLWCKKHRIHHVQINEDFLVRIGLPMCSLLKVSNRKSPSEKTEKG